MADQKAKRASPAPVRRRIEALLDPSKTCAEIAEAANTSPEYVSEIAIANGVKLKRSPNPKSSSSWPPERVELLRHLLFDLKLRYSVAAARMKMSRNAIIGKAARMGWADGSAKIGRPNGRKDSRPRRCMPRHTTASVSRPERPQFTADYVSPPPSEYDVPRKRLADLEAEDCRFPVDLPNGKGFGFCALERAPGVSYCPEHARRCLNPVPPRANQKAPANDREKVEA